MRWKDLKRRFINVAKEFKGETIGLIGLSIVIAMVLIGAMAPVIAPNTNSQWDNVDRWQDTPNGAPPAWSNFLSPEDKAPHQVKESPDDKSSQSVITTLSYNYQYDGDLPPKDIMVYLKGEYESEKHPEMIIDLIRPDGKKLRLVSQTIRGKESNGKYTISFDRSRATVLGGNQQRQKVYRFARQYEEGDLPDASEIEVSKTMFSKAQDGILTNSEPLNGEYEVKISVIGENTDIEDSRVVYTGRVYGLMGTDDNGRDISLGWVWGARYGLILGLAVATGTVVIGLFFGMTSAYYGGWVDEVMQRLNEIAMGIPTLPILVIIAVSWKQSIWAVILVMMLLYWRGIAKVIRSRGLQIRQNTYVEAAEALGASGGGIIRSHMIPQMLPYAFAEGALMIPIAIIAAAGLNVLGLGDPNIVTWGKMLSQANSAGATIRGMWWWVLIPGLGITLLGFAFISAGMAVERVVNPKMKQE